MGFGSIWHWVLVLVVICLIFGTKKLRNIGEDLGAGIKGFKEGLKQENDENIKANDSNDIKKIPNNSK